MADTLCSQHSGFESRISHIEREIDKQSGEIHAMREQQKFNQKRFTQILITLIFVLVGIICNLGYAITKG